jgi:hypothetical protein
MCLDTLAEDLRMHKISLESKESKEAREAKATKEDDAEVLPIHRGMKEFFLIGTKEQIKKTQVKSWRSLDPSSYFKDGNRI